MNCELQNPNSKLRISASESEWERKSDVKLESSYTCIYRLRSLEKWVYGKRQQKTLRFVSFIKAKVGQLWWNQRSFGIDASCGGRGTMERLRTRRGKRFSGVRTQSLFVPHRKPHRVRRFDLLREIRGPPPSLLRRLFEPYWWIRISRKTGDSFLLLTTIHSQHARQSKTTFKNIKIKFLSHLRINIT